MIKNCQVINGKTARLLYVDRWKITVYGQPQKIEIRWNYPGLITPEFANLLIPC